MNNFDMKYPESAKILRNFDRELGIRNDELEVIDQDLFKIEHEKSMKELSDNISTKR